MSEARTYAIGIDVGVTNVKSACISVDGQIHHQATELTQAETPDWPEGIRRRVADLESKNGQPLAIGIAAPGLAAADGRSIAWMQGRLQAVEGLDWARFLNRSQPVSVLNDAQAGLIAEAWIGAARDAKNVVMLTLGTGVGGAVMIDGRLVRGHIGRAGHLGHISLNPDGVLDIVNTPGSLEAAIGNCTIHDRTGGRFASTHDLIAAHRSGDARASEIWLRSIQRLAAGLASLINVVDPEMVIIGGGIGLAGPSLFQPLSQWMDTFEWRPHGRRVSIVPARLGEFSGAIGAAKNAMDHI